MAARDAEVAAVKEALSKVEKEAEVRGFELTGYQDFLEPISGAFLLHFLLELGCVIPVIWG